MDRQADAVKILKAELLAGRARAFARIDRETCTGCGSCEAACPTGAVTVDDTSARVNVETCSGCGSCVEACPSGAVRLV